MEFQIEFQFQSTRYRRSIRAMPICKLFSGIYRNRRKIIVAECLSVAVSICLNFPDTNGKSSFCEIKNGSTDYFVQ